MVFRRRKSKYLQVADVKPELLRKLDSELEPLPAGNRSLGKNCFTVSLSPQDFQAYLPLLDFFRGELMRVLVEALTRNSIEYPFNKIYIEIQQQPALKPRQFLIDTSIRQDGSHTRAPDEDDDARAALTRISSGKP